MDLPELRNYLGQFLPIPSLKACICACKQWHAALVPFIWADIQLDTYRKCPTDLTLRKHRKYIRQLSVIEVDFNGPLSLHYPNLETLKICLEGPITKNQGAVILQRLGSNLRNITISESGSRYPSTRAFWIAFAEDANMPFIQVNEIRITAEDMNSSRDANQHSRSMVLQLLRSLPAIEPLSSVSPCIERLEFETIYCISVMDQLLLILQCPALRHLSWKRAVGSLPWEELAEATRSGYWSHLESLDFLNTPKIDYLRLATILSSMKRLVSLHVNGRGTRLEFLQELRRHFGTVQDLHLCCKDIPGPFIHEVLASCPHLTSFCAGLIRGKDVMASEPWVCKDLNHLRLVFENETVICESQWRVVFKQLGRLSRLEVLDFNDIIQIGDTFQTSPEFRLDHGLALLSGLNRLREVHSSFSRQSMGHKDVEWIVSHWPQLKRFAISSLNSDKVTHDELQKVFHSHGIKC